MARRRVLIIGDCHFPWARKDVLNAILKRIDDFQPEAIVQIGDIYDFFSFAKFNRSFDFITPKIEVLRARESAEKLWEGCHDRAPGAKLYLIAGNHDVRPVRKILDQAPELEVFVREKFEELLTFKRVHSVFETDRELIIDDVSYFHGHFLQLGQHMRKYHKNCVVGHTHRGGVAFQPWNGEIKWELNAGFVGNKDAVPLRYTQHRAFSDWTLGWGEVDHLGPRFVPFKG